MRPGFEVNSWVLGTKLGSGYFGEVFVGYDAHQSHQMIALKFLPVEAGGIQRTDAEVDALFQLSHENIVAYRERPFSVTVDGCEFLAFGLELCDATLDEVLVASRSHPGSTDGPMSADQLLRWVVPDVLAALAYLRRQPRKIVHRDIHMGNVLVRDGVWKIGDFGLARHVDASGLYSSEVAGLRSFKSPEELERGEASNASDLYMLGAMVFSVLTGVDSGDAQLEVDPGHSALPDDWRPFVSLTCGSVEVRRSVQHLTAEGMQVPQPGDDFRRTQERTLGLIASIAAAKRVGVTGSNPQSEPAGRRPVRADVSSSDASSVHPSEGRPGPVSLVAPVTSRDGIARVYVIDWNGRLWERIVRSGSGGAGWSIVDTPTQVVAVGGGSHTVGHVEVFVADQRGALVHRWWTETGWSEWHDMVPPTGAATFAAWSSLEPGHFELFVLDPTGVPQHRWWVHGAWSDWEDFGEGQVVGLSSIVAVSCGFGQQMVFAVSEFDRTVVTRSYSEFNGSWSRWARLDDQPGAVASVAAASIRDGHVEVFAVGADGSIWQTGWGRTPGWSEWRRFGSPAVRSVTTVAAGSFGPGHQEVFAVDDRGMLWNRWCEEHSGSRVWSDWDVLLRPLSLSEWRE